VQEDLIGEEHQRMRWCEAYPTFASRPDFMPEDDRMVGPQSPSEWHILNNSSFKIMKPVQLQNHSIFLLRLERETRTLRLIPVETRDGPQVVVADIPSELCLNCPKGYASPQRQQAHN
jgi:hypothetical protein